MFQSNESKILAVAAQTDIIRGKNHCCLCRVLQGRIMKCEKCMCRDCLKVGSSLFFSDSYILVYYALYHHKLTIFTPVCKTAPAKHVSNTIFVLLSFGDEPCSSVLDHFWLIDFAFIVGVPDRTSDGIVRDLQTCFLTEFELVLRFRRRKPRVLLVFVQTLFTWPFHE